MKRILIFLILSITMFPSSNAQFFNMNRDSINQLNRQDHQLMMQKLGIESLRPGPSGNPEDPNAANSDESKAKTYTSLPDPLVFNDGTPVKTPGQWKKRKEEIRELFDREMYGRLPDNIPGVKWKITDIKDTIEGKYPVCIKTVKGQVDNSSYPDISVTIDLTVVTPAQSAGQVPVIMEFGWNFPANWQMEKPAGPTWEVQLLEQGWGYAILIPTSVQADYGAGLREGIIGLVNKGKPRKLDDWGALRAWAWGASRAMDYFESDNDVDEKRVGIEGLSRYGKAALVAMAYEPRIAIGFIGSSGAGGAKLLRRTFGEQVENLASSDEYHWFAPNFIKYAGPLTPNDLPVDAHELISLCAPRPVFISVGAPDVEGTWIDAKGMFLAAVHAGPVYELLGKDGMGLEKMPPQETNCSEGDIAFRQHEGGHTTGPNWPYFIEFAKRYFNKKH
jgi:hypothetical protein